MPIFPFNIPDPQQREMPSQSNRASVPRLAAQSNLASGPRLASQSNHASGPRLASRSMWRWPCLLYTSDAADD